MTYSSTIIPESVMDKHLIGGMELYGRWLWDISTNLLYWDRNIFKVYGIDESSYEQCQINHSDWFKAPYDNFAQLILKEDHEPMWQALNKAIFSKQPYSFIFRIRNKINEIRYIYSHGLTGYIEGAPLYVSGVNCNISDPYNYDVRRR